LLYDPKATTPARTLFVESQRMLIPTTWRKCAVMTDRWRLVNGKELYDIQADPGQKRNIAKKHGDVIEKLRKAYLTDFWASVTQGDELFAEPIVGAAQQREIHLVSEDAFPVKQSAQVPWSQAHVMTGSTGLTYWKIRVARKGTYRFEVRRWPREADTPMAGVYAFTRKPDAWQHDKPITSTIYGGKAKALPVRKIQLRVGNHDQTMTVQDGQKACVFMLDLPEGSREVEARMLNAADKPLGSAYYVYVRPFDGG